MRGGYGWLRQPIFCSALARTGLLPAIVPDNLDAWKFVFAVMMMKYGKPLVLAQSPYILRGRQAATFPHPVPRIPHPVFQINVRNHLTRSHINDILYIVIWLWSYGFICGGCGEAANTADCGSVTRGFEPHHSPHFFFTLNSIWGYRQAVRQRTLTPLSVVRLHLPLPEIKNCRNTVLFC